MNYRDRIYGEYVSGHAGHLYGEVTLESLRRQYPFWEAYFGKLLPESREAAIVDLGCGEGGFVHWLREKGYGKASGIDVSPEQVARGKALGIEGVVLGKIEDFLPAHSGEYDCIVARDVLEHFRKDEILPLLDAMFGALRPGGVFIAQTVNAESPFWGRLRHADFTHEGAFTKESIAQVLRASGFAGIEVFPQRPVAHGLKSFLRRFLWQVMELRNKTYLLAETGSADGIFTQNLIVKAQKPEA